MKTYYISALFLLSALGASAPAAAACGHLAPASSTTVSCENGVKVYRGQQNGPDFRYAVLAQNQKIAEARARAAEARAQAQQNRPVPVTVNQNNNAGRSGFVNDVFFAPQARLGFQNFRNAAVPRVGGNFSRGRLVGRNVNRRFGGRGLGRRGLGSRGLGRRGLSSRSVSSPRVSLAGANARPAFGAAPRARSSALRGGS